MKNNGYILRAAVSGNDRDELCNNLIALADVISHSVLPVYRDNAIGEEVDYSFDYEVSPRGKDEIVSIALGS